MQKAIDLTLSSVASLAALALSWPYWRSFSYFAESRTAWWLYMVIGYALAVFVFYVFFRALRTLFSHEGHEAHAHHGHVRNERDHNDQDSHAHGRHAHHMHDHGQRPDHGTTAPGGR
jgi:ABC-type nickel/cobalt efflux system permease component RcnA